jgi:hypothetical protein
MEDQEVNPNIQRIINLLQKDADLERTKRMGYENDLAQISAFSPIKEPNLVEYQLDLKEELDRIFHLLSGHIIIINEDGSEIWEEPDDDRLKIFSDYGVKQIMNIISFYVNRNTLMSFYDADTILWKIKDFGNELNDLLFNRYEVFFHYPTPEELFDLYLPIVKERDINIDEDELYTKCVQWSKEELQQKIRHYPMMILALIDTIHSTYNRALGGKERQSLRERLNISQNATQITDNYPTQENKSRKLWNPKTW